MAKFLQKQYLNLLIINNLQHIYQDIQVFILIMSVLIAIILLLYIYRIFVFASIQLFLYRGWGYLFFCIQFFFVDFWRWVYTEIWFSLLQGKFCGVVHTYSFSEGESAKAAFSPLPRGNRCAQYIKMTICKTKQNNSYQNDMIKMKIFKLQTL